MCQSQAEGGKRCAAYTRPRFKDALDSVATAQGGKAIIEAQVVAIDAVAAHAATSAGAAEVAAHRKQAEREGDTVTADFLRSCENVAATMREVHQAVSREIAARPSPAAVTTPTQASTQPSTQPALPVTQPASTSTEEPAWDPGTPSTDVGEHWSIAEGGTRWHEGGCGAFAIAMTERWPHLKIAAEMYDDHGAESVAHAWAYDPATNTRFHIFGAETWQPTTRPDYDPDSHRVLLEQSPDDIRRLFRGFNTGEDAVFDGMEVACEMFDPDYVADDEYERSHLYF